MWMGISEEIRKRRRHSSCPAAPFFHRGDIAHQFAAASPRRGWRKKARFLVGKIRRRQRLGGGQLGRRARRRSAVRGSGMRLGAFVGFGVDDSHGHSSARGSCFPLLRSRCIAAVTMSLPLMSLKDCRFKARAGLPGVENNASNRCALHPSGPHGPRPVTIQSRTGLVKPRGNLKIIAGGRSRPYFETRSRPGVMIVALNRASASLDWKPTACPRSRLKSSTMTPPAVPAWPRLRAAWRRRNARFHACWHAAAASRA